MKNDKPSYNRITQKWRCGRSASGSTCPLGPDKRGHCRGSFECQPNNTGERWVCTRSKKRGGPCKKGPDENGACCHAITVCQPILNKRIALFRWTLWILLILILIGAILLGTHRYGRVYSPGPLSKAHANLTCSDCHRNYKRPLSWAKHVFVSSDNHQITCTRCHGFKNNAHHPHTLSPTMLSTLSQSQRAQPHSSATSCLQCHQEHQGRQHTLVDAPAASCQACHRNVGAKFATEHPAFHDFPKENYHRIIKFNHRTHFSNYFKEKKFAAIAPTSCSSCHQFNNKLGIAHFAGFKASCQACHNDKIMSVGMEGEKGIPVLNVFALDVDTLKKHHINIGSWPESADEDMPPLERLFLSSTPKLKKAFATLGDIELSDLSDATPKQLEAAKKIIWSYKEFLYNIQHEGHDAILKVIKRMSNQTWHKHPFALPSEDTIHFMVRAWFPQLDSEIKAYRAGNPAVTLLNPDDSAVIEKRSAFTKHGEAWTSQGGWYWSGYQLYYAPRMHADPFMLTWLNYSFEHRHNLAAKHVFEELSSDSTPGSCSSCHNLADQTQQKHLIWDYKKKTPLQHAAMTFNHNDHLNIPGLTCHTCHVMSKEDNAKRNFFAIKKSTCSVCHRTGKVESTCTSCHQYHLISDSTK
ncbi:MAG: hypothetical protein COB66_07630 [Coxiella sp. (in: Bacteria)]|nr:MAG: hypothetical protein COB66_07630 [Coxiella sp. (in: g-proteobacteria)]